MQSLNVTNYAYGWKDASTFTLTFDGGTDEDGDSFFFCCEYWADVKEWHFEKIYDYDYTDADFTPEQEHLIKTLMENLMCDRLHI